MLALLYTLQNMHLLRMYTYTHMQTYSHTYMRTFIVACVTTYARALHPFIRPSIPARVYGNTRAHAIQRLTGVPLASGALRVFGFCGFLRKFCGMLRIVADVCGILAEFCRISRNFAEILAEFCGQTLRAPGPKVTSVRL